MEAVTTKNQEYLSTRIPPDMFEKIEQMAEQEKRPLSSMTRILLEEALQLRAKKTKKSS